MTVRDLRDVLRERAEGPAPANPARFEDVRRRVRRTRRRRGLVAAAATAVATAMAGAVVFALLPASPEPWHGTAEPPARVLPERFTARDGTAYRRLAAATVRTEGTTKASVTIPVTGKPLDVAGLCAGEFGASPPSVTVSGVERTTFPHLSPCLKDMELIPLVVPSGAGRVTITFDTATQGGGCVRGRADGPCVPQTPPKAVWSLAVYEWTPPARPVDPGPLKDFPERLARWKRAAVTPERTWPGDRTFTLTVEGGGRIGVQALCDGDLAARMWFQYHVEGGGEVSATCGRWTSGPFPMALHELAVPHGKRVTVRIRAGIHGAATNRPVRWAVAVYRRG